ATHPIYDNRNGIGKPIEPRLKRRDQVPQQRLAIHRLQSRSRPPLQQHHDPLVGNRRKWARAQGNLYYDFGFASDADGATIQRKICKLWEMLDRFERQFDGPREPPNTELRLLLN